MLLRLDVMLLCGGFTEMKELPDLPPELSQVAVLIGGQIAVIVHMNIVTRYNWGGMLPAQIGPVVECPSSGSMIVMTIGHSTHPSKEFIHLLKAHGVQRLVDVRTVPRSRHNPQFNRSELSPALHAARLHYRYMPGLGGFRHARRDSVNTGWHNASFRGFADYMQTPEFRKNLDDLIELAKSERIAIMCAEAVPWRCHRSLIADALLARGIEVREITSATRTQPHTLTPWGKITGMQVTYPAEHKD
jgi:hypothetical protein